MYSHTCKLAYLQTCFWSLFIAYLHLLSYLQTCILANLLLVLINCILACTLILANLHTCKLVSGPCLFIGYLHVLSYMQTCTLEHNDHDQEDHDDHCDDDESQSEYWNVGTLVHQSFLCTTNRCSALHQSFWCTKHFSAPTITAVHCTKPFGAPSTLHQLALQCQPELKSSSLLRSTSKSITHYH